MRPNTLGKFEEGARLVERADYDELLAFARDLAHRAGEILLHGRPDAPRFAQVATATKTSPTDIVTERDLASEKFIVDAITKFRPQDGLLGEEGARRPSQSGLHQMLPSIMAVQ